VRDIVPWIAAVLLFGFFVLGAIANASILMMRPREDGSKPSMIPFIPGIAGAVALAIAPWEPLNRWFWLPLVLDVGTGLYGLLALVAIAAAAFSGEMPTTAEAAPPLPLAKALAGCILGTAVGDALGLACEGLSRERQRRMFPNLDGYRLLPFGVGMCSDDTEHTCMLAQSVVDCTNSAENLQEKALVSAFAWRLRFWLLGLPAGIGLATLRAILKLWIGIPGRWSGVYSAGNGPAMRSAFLGVFFGDSPARLRVMVRAATRITHTDPKAEHGAFAVALAAHLATRGADVAPADYLAALKEHVDDAEFVALIARVSASVARGESAEAFADSLGCGKGVGGYIYHSVPCALHVWLSHQADYRAAVLAMVRLGGDSDTTAAIVGGIVGARVGKEGIPPEWLRKLKEWPRTVAWMERLGHVAAVRHQSPMSVESVPSPGALKILLRNAFFLAVVLLHGLRRLLPPY
jgi:ADP-ribosylglycohydrolase